MIKRFKRALTGLALLLAGATALTGCSGSGGGSGGGGNNSTPTTTSSTTTTTKPSTTTTTYDPTTSTTTSVPTTSSTTTTTQPGNQSPQFTAFPNPDATEGELYQINLFYNDADGDDVECSLIQNPFGAYASLVPDGAGKCKLTIDTPQDDVSGQNNFVKVKLDDGNGGVTEQGKNIYVRNTETASGWVGGFNSGEGLEGILVELDDETNYYSALTNADGEWEIPGVLDGNFWFTMSDELENHINYQAGNLEVSKEQQGNMDTAFMLLPKADQEYFQGVLYGDGSGNPLNLEAIAKWMTKPSFKIYLKDKKDSTYVAQDKVDLAESVILTELNQFFQGVYTINTSDMQEIDGIYNGTYNEGDFVVYWNSNFSGGGNASTVQDNEILSSRVNLNKNVGKEVMLQELSSGMINDGETQNSSYSDSVFYNIGLPTATQYSDEDLTTSMATYGIWSRPNGTIFDLDEESEIVLSNYSIN